MLTALEREFALTTAWARERREESGWLGCVYFSNVTAKARTRGARLVCSTVWESSSSLVSMVGSEREVSIAAGLDGSASDSRFGFLAGVGGEASVEERFFDIRFAVSKSFLAVFSSGKICLIVAISDLARWAGLSKYENRVAVA